jgi:hypothetical protein
LIEDVEQRIAEAEQQAKKIGAVNLTVCVTSPTLHFFSHSSSLSNKAFKRTLNTRSCLQAKGAGTKETKEITKNDTLQKMVSFNPYVTLPLTER